MGTPELAKWLENFKPAINESLFHATCALANRSRKIGEEKGARLEMIAV